MKTRIILTATLAAMAISPNLASAETTAPAAAQSPRTLTLTTYNIHSGIPFGSSSANYTPGPRDMHNIAGVLNTVQADIVALQEVRNNHPGPQADKPDHAPINMSNFLAALMNMDYAFASSLELTPGYPENRDYLEWGNVSQWTNNGKRQGHYGNAILSRYSLAGPPQSFKLPMGGPDAPRPDEPRVLLRAELKDPLPRLGRVVIYSTHLHHNYPKSREAQMKAVLEIARRDAESATVFILGDFNYRPDSDEADLLGMARAAGFGDLAARYAAETGTEPETTILGRRPARIDYIFCNRDVKITDVNVLQTEVSDHRPVTITISLE